MMTFRNEWGITLHVKVKEDKYPHSVKGKEPEFKQMGSLCPSLQLRPDDIYQAPGYMHCTDNTTIPASSR